MSAHKVLAIGLDGYEESLERRLIEAGELPFLARLRSHSARYLLDHGAAQRTGLAWEHVSTGLSPDRARRWAAVHFDPETYAVWQEGTRLEPFPARLKSRTIVFDAPYFDLNQAPQVRGLVGWGAHDPGVRLSARPVTLLSEFRARFGDYPAEDWLYGHVWSSPHRARQMGEALAEGVRVRARATRWLLGERLPDWDLALVVVSEPHSAIEGLWHGIDVSHRLHSLPSASAAHDGLIMVYRAVDDLVSELVSAFCDRTIVVFSMGGMGPNHSDVPSMVLLPELMYRHSFGRSYLQQPNAWTAVSGPGPKLEENQEWATAINMNLAASQISSPRPPTLLTRLKNRVKHVINDSVQRDASTKDSPPRPSIRWMPASRYQQSWHAMRAFALPSYYDGRIRINLAGRERRGRVFAGQYQQVCDEVETLLRECRDPATGEEIVDGVERASTGDPLKLEATEADLVIVWRESFCALDHPKLGRIGPVPFRRPGGHTGRFGMAYFSNAALGVGDQGIRSSFDIVPSLIDLLGEPIPSGLSGASLLNDQRSREGRYGR